MSTHVKTHRSRAGFTMIELMVGLALLGLIIVNVYMVLADSSKAYGSKTVQANTEMQLRRTLDRIALAVMSSSRGTLWTATDSPLSESELHFETSLGMENGVPIWSDPQKIGLTPGEGQQVTWFQNPGGANEKRIVWSKWIADFAKGELLNGIDDNGNGLIDEKGLSFVVDGNSVTIRLTIQQPGPQGTWVTKNLEATVTCRN
jgi:prepilin-type N-terminal cleavage/methylation domain-containing protein